MKPSMGEDHLFTSKRLIWLAGAFLLAVTLHGNQASAQSSLPGYGTGYGFSGGVGWGTLPSTPPSRGSGYASQFRAGRTPTNTYRVPAQVGNQRYGVPQYGYAPGYSAYRQPIGGYGAPVYRNGYVPYGYGYNTYGLQINAYPGGVIQTFQGPIRW